jgi:hypothetical protein
MTTHEEIAKQLRKAGLCLNGPFSHSGSKASYDVHPPSRWSEKARARKGLPVAMTPAERFRSVLKAAGWQQHYSNEDGDLGFTNNVGDLGAGSSVFAFWTGVNS